MSDWTPVEDNTIVPPPRSFGAGLAALYTCRVPISAGVFLVLLPVICLWLAPTLFRNLLVMDAPSAFWSVAAVYVFSWSIQVTYRVIAINRAERFRLPGPWAASPPGRTAIWITRALPLPLLIAMAALKGDNNPVSGWPQFLLAIAAGFALAYLLAFFAVFFAAFVSPPGHVEVSHFFNLRFAVQRRLVGWAGSCEFFASGGQANALGRLLQRIEDPGRHYWPNGYVQQSNGRIYGGHWIALTSFLLSLLLYLGLGFFKSSNVPALSYVVQLCFLSVWALAGASFFLDRFRIPLTSPFVVWSLINILPTYFPACADLPIWLPSSDHFYNTWPQQTFQANPATPERVLEAYSTKTKGRLIVVATAGGGIQAAAWTAEVLTHLQSTMKPGPNARTFADSISAFSGVSGGGVGMMFYGFQYPGGVNSAFRTDSAQLKQIVDDSESATLNEVAWGLTHPDLTRFLFPLSRVGSFKMDDRGNALEDAWKRTLDEPGTQAGSVSLAAWTHGPEIATRPAFLFNSTLAETGEPFVFATTALTYSPRAYTKAQQSRYAHRRTFFAEHPDRDVDIVTAARMGASFPYVTPAARPLIDGVTDHQVDGGYYDNYGLDTLMAWLAEALDHLPPAKPDILILQIRSFPRDAVPAPTRRTWFYQTYAPLDALFNARTTGQSLGDAESLTAFEKAYASKANFVDACFEFQGDDAPLSWQMSGPQILAINDQWPGQSDGKTVVQDFLNGTNNALQKGGCDPAK